MAHTEHCPQVRFLGTGDAEGSGGRSQTCFALQDADRVVLIECGETTPAGLRQHGVDAGQVRGIVVSHLHADHAGGLPTLIHQQREAGRRTPLLIWGPRGMRDWLARSLAQDPPAEKSSAFDVQVFEMEPGEIASAPEGNALDDVELMAVEVDHPCETPALAVRVTMGGHTVAYTGCTSWTPSLSRIGREADLYIMEAYSWDEDVPGHLRYVDIADHLPELGAKRVILTHLSAGMLRRLDEADVAVASDGDLIDLD